MDLTIAASLLLTLYAVVAFLDGVLLHLVHFQLYAHPESRREHAIHTVRAVLFVPAVVLLFALPAAGPLLWLGVGIAALDLGIGFWDGWEEGDSRRRWGGLPRAEYLAHVAASLLHGGALATLLAAKTPSAWRWDAGWLVPGAGPGIASSIAMGLLPGAVLMALLHVWLLVAPVRLPVLRGRQETTSGFQLLGGKAEA